MTPYHILFSIVVLVTIGAIVIGAILIFGSRKRGKNHE